MTFKPKVDTDVVAFQNLYETNKKIILIPIFIHDIQRQGYHCCAIYQNLSETKHLHSYPNINPQHSKSMEYYTVIAFQILESKVININKKSLHRNR